jgi:hypothetical protein
MKLLSFLVCVGQCAGVHNSYYYCGVKMVLSLSPQIQCLFVRCWRVGTVLVGAHEHFKVKVLKVPVFIRRLLLKHF